jgi:hypothetical protein
MDGFPSVYRTCLIQRLSQIMQSLLHTPWWIALLMAVVGIALFMSGNRRQDKTLQQVGMALTLLAILLGTLGWIFPTDLEKCEQRTRQMVKAVDKGDWNTVRSLLDDQTELESHLGTVAVGADQILQRSRAAYDRFGVKSAWILGMQSSQAQTTITITIDVISTQDATQDQGVSSRWQFEYEQVGTDWQLQKITLLGIAGDNGEKQFEPFAQ